MSGQLQEFIRVEQDGSIFEICINRPDKKNALNLDMYEAISKALEAAEACSEVRVIILTGAEGSFTSGNDLAVFANPADLLASDNPIFRFMSVFRACKKPIIAAVDGVAIGIGTTLLLHCDIVFASTSSEFKLPFVNLGLTPEFASSVILPKLVGHAKASEWLLLGANISAEEALASGLINRVDSSPLELAREMAQSLSLMPPQAVSQTKALLREPLNDDVDRAIKNEAKLFIKALSGPEFAEAASAFFEKRKPDFSKC